MIKNNITVKPENNASSKPVFEINQTLFIPVTIDRVVQYSDKETTYFVKMPEGISYFLSDCPPVAVINEGSLKKMVSVRFYEEMPKNADECGRRIIP